MSINVSARDIDAMRHARHVDLTEADGTAVLACHLTRVPPIRPLITSIPVPIAAADADLGASPSRGGRTLALTIRHARRNPTWAALVNTVRDGDQLEVQWERNGYALLLVRSRGEVEDRFAFPATRQTRRALNEAQPRRPGRPARVLAALTALAGRVPVPGRRYTSSPDTTPEIGPATNGTEPVRLAVGDDR